MWSINFLPWYEQRQLAYRRFYCKVVCLISLLFMLMQMGLYWYFSHSSVPIAVKKVTHVVKPACDDQLRQRLMLQAVFLANTKSTLMAQNETGETMVVDKKVLHQYCWELLVVENNGIKIKHIPTQRIEFWELGTLLPKYMESK